MGPENLESLDPGQTAAKPAADAPFPSEPADPLKKASLGVSALIDRMVQAGEWPDPELLDEIVNAGDAALEPLLAFVRTNPRGWPAEASLEIAMGLLTVLGLPAAIPDMVDVCTRRHDETSAQAADVLAACGPVGFDALIDLCSNPSIKGYERSYVFDAAVNAAGDDPARRSRLAATIRPILEDVIGKAREELRIKGALEKNPPVDDLLDGDEDVDWDEELDELEEWGEDALEDGPLDDDDEFEAGSPEDLLPSEDHFEEVDEIFEPFIAEEVAIAVGALADLADPLALGSIKTAFQEGLVDEALVNEEYVEKQYAVDKGPREEEPDSDWLSIYRQDYAAHIEASSPPAPPPPLKVHRPKYRYEDRYQEPEPPDIPATAPIRNAGPKVGRNDPCWCGSGKKYKKCHLGKDRLAEPD